MWSNFYKSRLRNIVITFFVILWTTVFQYESIRYFYLNPLFDKPLPKVKFLFPPAGWIMFYNVDDRFGHLEVYGSKDGTSQLIDPHDIFRTRTIGFDNIHRGILGTVSSRYKAAPFCRYMIRRFPYFDRFVISYIHHPSITKSQYKQTRTVLYACPLE